MTTSRRNVATMRAALEDPIMPDRGPFFGGAAAGRPIDLGGMTILAFRDGHRVGRWRQADFLTVQQQIGGLRR